MNKRKTAKRNGRSRSTPFAGLVSGVLFLLTFGVKRSARLAEFDHKILARMATMRTESWNGVAADFTALGSRTVIIFFYVVGTGWTLLAQDTPAMVQLIVAGVGAAALSPLLKSFVRRPRPTESGIESLVRFSTHSFPSGHSLAAAVFYLTVALLLGRGFEAAWVRGVVCAAAILQISLIGATRLYLGAHFPSDVLGGTLVGILWAVLANAAARKILECCAFF